MTRLSYLSLFSGIGGGDLACQHLLGWECRGYVEKNKRCCGVLERRVRDGFLADAPIFRGDIERWIEQGYASAYTGMVSVVAAGFPCQPFSLAGDRRGAGDSRNMWPATLAAISEIRPRFAFLENVPGLVSSGYLGTILGDLAQSGYDARWRVLSAAELGAPHKRDRLWIVAHTARERCQRLQDTTRQAGEPGTQSSDWWQAEPALDRVADGTPDRMVELKAIGNAQVPLVAATAWRLLTADMDLSQ